MHWWYQYTDPRSYSVPEQFIFLIDWLIDGFCKIVGLPQVLQKNSSFSQKNLKNKFNIFQQNNFYPYPYLSHCVMQKCFASMISFIIYYLCHLFLLLTGHSLNQRSNCSTRIHGKSAKYHPPDGHFFAKYWFPSLNLIQESHDNGDSLLIFSMSGPRGFKPWWPVITLWASTGCQERWVKCDLAESPSSQILLLLI